jgi:hypothetical protein
VAVLPVSRLTVVLEEKPQAVIAGEEYSVAFRVINQGNSETAVSLSAKSTQGYPVRLSEPTLTLPPGSSRVAKAVVKTDAKIKRRLTDVLQIEARIVEGKDQAPGGIAVTMDIIPKMSTRADTYHRIPSELQVALAGESGTSGWQIEFAGAGPLNEIGDRFLDFLFRAPNIEDTAFFGKRDEYRLNYASPDLDLRLGDQTYGLSPLTEYYQYGRGIGVDLRPNDGSDLGVYFVDSRWDVTDSSQIGFHVGSRFSDRLRLKLNVLNKGQNSPSDIDDSLWSVEGAVKPWPDANFDFEYSGGHSSRNGGVEGRAYRAGLDGRSGQTNYSFGKIHAGSDYFGYYSDADYSNWAIAFPLAGRLRGDFAGQRWLENLRLDPAQVDAPFEEYYRAGLDYNLSERSRLSFDLNHFERRDRMDPAAYRFTETSLKFGLGRSFPNASLQVYLDQGRQKDALTGETRRANRYSVYYYVRGGSRQYFTLYSQIADDNLRESRLLGSSSTVGAAGYWQPSDHFSLSLSYALNGFNLSTRGKNRQFYATAIYRADDDRYWTLRLRNSNQSLGSEASYLLSYTLRWGLPITRKTSLGSIRGKVYDAEKPGKPGIARLIVSASGSTVAADDNGEFEFPSLAPGTYAVSVELDSLELGSVTAVMQPVLVEVETRGVFEVSIPVTRSARLAGKVALYAYGPGKQMPPTAGETPGVFVGAPADNGTGAVQSSLETGELVEARPLAEILLELTNGSEVLRTSTDAGGAFSVSDLRPGFWRLKVYGHNLPALHYPEPAEAEFDLKPGEQRHLAVRVAPRLRPVQIIEEGVITSGK